jgi:hypothetical protein
MECLLHRWQITSVIEPRTTVKTGVQFNPIRMIIEQNLRKT